MLLAWGKGLITIVVGSSSGVINLLGQSQWNCDFATHGRFVSGGTQAFSIEGDLVIF